MMRDVRERFLEKVRRHPTDCWEWTAHAAPHGYGQFWWQGSAQWAHRVAFTLFVRTIRRGFAIDHTCQNTRCVRPSHLREVRPSTNSRLQWVRKRVAFAQAARKRLSAASDTSRASRAPVAA